jgi:hypothetical protein
MKGCFIIAMSILPLVAFTQAERIEVPWKVKIQFMEDYVSAANTTWQQDANNNYNVSFFHQSQNKTATYSVEGVKLVTKTKLTSLSQVPANIAHETKIRLKNFTIEEISKVESAQQISYEMTVRRERNTYNLIFDPSGKFRRKRI